MSQITDTAYPIIKPHLSAIELEALFMPSADEIAEASRLNLKKSVNPTVRILSA
jgi:hypothetical protein